jgi:phage-related protein|tara:strand:- start:890 stop:1282 length:393 start_codon:yes stop_codon:yes gene_type:complete
MAIGFQISGTSITTATIIPDKTLARSSAPRVRSAKFGDGYEQRAKSGLNSIDETFTLNFVNRTKATIDDLNKFFDDKAGVTSFNFTIPDTDNTTTTGEKTIRVVCSEWSTQYSNSDHYSMSASFVRIYQP